jgi:N-acetylmuramoyl-L-alanine amidase
MLVVAAFVALVGACGAGDEARLSVTRMVSTTPSSDGSTAAPSGHDSPEPEADPGAVVDETTANDRAAPERGAGSGDEADTGVSDAGVLELDLAPSPTGGVITATGVPVVHLARTGDGDVITTPCGAVATVRGATPIDAVRVVLDPGHGGPIDTGAVGGNGLVERDLNLDVAVAAVAVLAERGIGAAVTRTADYAVPLPVRAAFADALGVEAMISIHHNAPTPGASPTPGTEVFVQSGSVASAVLGGIVLDEVVAALATFDIAWSAAPDAGVLLVLNTDGIDAYGMIRRPATPTVLAELGYLSNPAEAELFATDAYVEIAARAIADAAERYLAGGPMGSTVQPEPRVFDPAAAPGADVCEDPPLE